MLAAHAAVTAQVAPTQTTAFQLFKLALSLLANTDWQQQRLVYGVAEATTCSRPGFYDHSGAVDFFARLGTVEELRWEAQRALRALDQEAPQLSGVPLGVRRSLSSWSSAGRPRPSWSGPPGPCGGVRRAAEDLTLRSAELPVAALCPALAGAEALALAERLSATLREGLGERCRRCAWRLVASGARWTSRPPPGPKLLLGLVLSPEHLERIIDRGPSAQEEQRTEKIAGFWEVFMCFAWFSPHSQLDNGPLKRFRCTGAAGATLSRALGCREVGAETLQGALEPHKS